MFVKVFRKECEDSINFSDVKNTYVQNGKLLVIEFWNSDTIIKEPGKDGYVSGPYIDIKIPLDDIRGIREYDEAKMNCSSVDFSEPKCRESAEDDNK